MTGAMEKDIRLLLLGALAELVNVFDEKKQATGPRSGDWSPNDLAELMQRDERAWIGARGVLYLDAVRGAPPEYRRMFEDREHRLREIAHALIVEADRQAAIKRRPDEEHA